MKPIIFLTASLCSALLLPACGKKTSGMPPRPPKPVIAVAARSVDVPLYLDEIGRCAAYESVTIQPQVSGPIAEIYFSDGSDVKKGDRLFMIDPRPYQATLDKAKAILVQDRAKAAFDQEQLQRNQKLIENRVAAVQELDKAQSAAAASQATLLADEAVVESAQINLDYCSILSPIDGRASKRLVDVGNVVAANTTPLLLIQRQDPIYAEFTIPESSLPQVRKFIKAGTITVEASFADDPSKSRVGKLDFLDSGVQVATGTVRLRATFDNSDRLFWPGQFVNIRILLDMLKEAVLIPSEAVQTGNKGPFVFVVKPDNTVELRLIKPGQRQGDDVVVSEGIQAGEIVVVTGQLALAPGAAVTMTPASSAN